MKRMLLGAAAVVLTSAAPAPDPLLARVAAEARAAGEASPAFERTTRFDADGKPGARVERYDPARTPAWTLVAVDGKPPGADALKAYAKDAAAQRAPAYGRVGLLLAGGAERLPGEPARYRVAKLPKAVVRSMGSGAAFGERLEAEVTIADAGGRPYASVVRFFAPKPFRMMLVAKVDRFEAVNTYARGPDGRPRIVAQTTVTAGSMPGRSGTVTTRAIFRPLAP